MPYLHGTAGLVCVEGGQRLLNCSPEKAVGRQESAFVVVPQPGILANQECTTPGDKGSNGLTWLRISNLQLETVMLVLRTEFACASEPIL